MSRTICSWPAVSTYARTASFLSRPLAVGAPQAACMTVVSGTGFAWADNRPPSAASSRFNSMLFAASPAIAQPSHGACDVAAVQAK